MAPIDGAKGLSKPIGSWDVSAVTDMRELFNHRVNRDVVPGANKFNTVFYLGDMIMI